MGTMNCSRFEYFGGCIPKESYPIFLYHYATPNLKRIRSTILNNEIHFLSRDQLNDPFDLKNKIVLDNMTKLSRRNKESFYGICRLLAGEVSEDRQEQKKWQDIMAKGPSNPETQQFLSVAINAGIEMIAQRTGIFCLTSDSLSIPMWSHYAQDHTGIAFQYKPDGVFREGRCAKVRYERDFVKFRDMARVFQSTHGDRLAFAMELFKLGYAWKAKQWSNEKEWRLFTKEAISSNLKIPDGAMKLTGVIFGWKMNEDMRDKVMNLVDESRCQVIPYEIMPLKGSMGIQMVTCRSPHSD